MAKDLGIHGNLFGGYMMMWIDEMGASYVCDKCQSSQFVTKSIDKLEFIRPVRIGQQIKFYGEVKDVGTTSVTIYLKANRYNVLSQSEKPVCDTTLVFVRIDPDTGDPIAIDKHVKKELLEEIKNEKHDENYAQH